MDDQIASLEDVQLHHYAVVVPRIEAYLRRSLWREAGDIVHDPVQRCRLCFVSLYPGMTPAIELVEPTDEQSPVWAAVKRGVTWHHLCLHVPTTRRADELIHQHGLVPVTGWKPAVLFDGRPVRFVYSRNRELIEFLSEDVEQGDERVG